MPPSPTQASISHSDVGHASQNRNASTFPQNYFTSSVIPCTMSNIPLLLTLQFRQSPLLDQRTKTLVTRNPDPRWHKHSLADQSPWLTARTPGHTDQQTKRENRNWRINYPSNKDKFRNQHQDLQPTGIQMPTQQQKNTIKKNQVDMSLIGTELAYNKHWKLQHSWNTTTTTRKY